MVVHFTILKICRFQQQLLIGWFVSQFEHCFHCKIESLYFDLSVHLIVAVGKNIFGQRVELRALLKDLRQHFHECSSRLKIFVISETDGVHQPGVDVGTQKIWHGLNCRVAERILALNIFEKKTKFKIGRLRNSNEDYLEWTLNWQ